MKKDIKELKETLNKLKNKLKIEKFEKPPHLIAGIDVAYRNNYSWAALVVMYYPELKLRGIYTLHTLANFPYITGLFSFREGPIILKLLKKVKPKPDLLFIDGQGIAHPQKMGLASFVGIKSGIATIGCTKKALLPFHYHLEFKKGNFQYLYARGEKVGIILCTKDNTKPIFVSPGHLVNIEDAKKYSLLCCKKSKIPLPLHLADIISSSQAKGNLL